VNSKKLQYAHGCSFIGAADIHYYLFPDKNRTPHRERGAV